MEFVFVICPLLLSKRRGTAENRGCSPAGLPVHLVEEYVLLVAHDLVVGGGAQGVVQARVGVQAQVSGLEARQPWREARAEVRAGVGAVALQEIQQIART